MEQSITLGGKVTIELLNSECRILGDIPSELIAKECSFVSATAAEILRTQKFDAEKNAIEMEVAYFAKGEKLVKKDHNALWRAGLQSVESIEEAAGRRGRKSRPRIDRNGNERDYDQERIDREDKNTIYLFDVFEKSFPIGLLDKVKGVLRGEGIQFTVVDKRVRPQKSLYWKFLSSWEDRIRDYQAEGAEYVEEYPQLLYDWATNAGKTLLMAMILEKLGVKTLLLTHSGVLARQCAKAFSEYMGAKCFILDSATSKKKGEDRFTPITIAVINSARNYVHQLREYGFDCVMVDEAHRSAASSYCSVVKHLNPYYMYGFSGTAFREDGTGLILEAQYGTFRPRQTNRQMIAAGYSSPVQIEVIEVEVDASKEDPWATVYKDGIANNMDYNGRVIEAAIYHVREGRQVAVQVTQRKQACLIVTALRGVKGISPVLVDGTYNAKRNFQALEDFKARKYNVVVGTVLDEGFDCDTLDVVINAGGYKALKLLKQRLGRVLRIREGKEFGIFVDFYVRGHYILERHARQRLEGLEAEGFKVPLLNKLRAKEAAEEASRQEEAKDLQKKLEESLKDDISKHHHKDKHTRKKYIALFNNKGDSLNEGGII